MTNDDLWMNDNDGDHHDYDHDHDDHDNENHDDDNNDNYNHDDDNHNDDNHDQHDGLQRCAFFWETFHTSHHHTTLFMSTYTSK